MNNTIEVSEDFNPKLQVWVGLDVSKATFDAALYLQSPLGQARSFERTAEGATQFLAWCDEALASLPHECELRMVMEATGNYSIELLGLLVQQRPELHLSIINPGYIKKFGESLGQRNKTDKADAQVIARYGAERRPQAHEPSDPTRAKLRKLVRERTHYVQMLTQHKVHCAMISDDLKEVKNSSKTVITTLENAIARIEAAMEALVKSDAKLKDDVKLLESICGVGRLTAVSILGELGDLRQFKSSRKLASFAGLSPRQCTSGVSVQKPTRMCKMGSPRVRSILYMPAVAAISKQTIFRRFYDKLVQRGKKKKAALGAVMRKMLLLMRSILISGERFDPEYSGKACGKDVESLGKKSAATPIGAV